MTVTWPLAYGCSPPLAWLYASAIACDAPRAFEALAACHAARVARGVERDLWWRDRAERAIVALRDQPTIEENIATYRWAVHYLFVYFKVTDILCPPRPHARLRTQPVWCSIG